MFYTAIIRLILVAIVLIGLVWLFEITAKDVLICDSYCIIEHVNSTLK